MPEPLLNRLWQRLFAGRPSPLNWIAGTAVVSIAALRLTSGGTFFHAALSAGLFVIGCALVAWSIYSPVQSGLLRAARRQYRVDIIDALPTAVGPVLAVVSFPFLCRAIDLQYPGYLFAGLSTAAEFDQIVRFAADSVLKTVLLDLPEVYGLTFATLTHNVEHFWAATLVFVFRTCIAVGVTRALIVYVAAH